MTTNKLQESIKERQRLKQAKANAKHLLDEKKEHPKEKSNLHPRNKHRERYNFKQLIKNCPALEQFVHVNDYGDESIDFFNPFAVKMLNKALLNRFYDIKNWNIPSNYLCPPIPGRADYIHYVADLLASKTENKDLLKGDQVKCLDIGVGANCVYPLIGTKEYGWSFVGADIDALSLDAAQKILEDNPTIAAQIELRIQAKATDIFYGMIQSGEKIDITICNPPFHASAAEAQAGTKRKLKNLGPRNSKKPNLNFGGQSNELWCKGGEEVFIRNMILQSKKFSNSCFWFTTLVSKEANLKNIYKTLNKVDTQEVKTIPMGQGNKKSRIVAWTFLSPAQQKYWAKERWT